MTVEVLYSESGALTILSRSGLNSMLDESLALTSLISGMRAAVVVIITFRMCSVYSLAKAEDPLAQDEPTEERVNRL